MSDKDVGCPKCGTRAKVGVEYAYGNKHRYDGISEYVCHGSLIKINGVVQCDWRIGRWCGETLTSNEVEPPFCDGGPHPRHIDLKDNDDRRQD